MRKLALTVEPFDRETLPSLFSRMAILNGTDAANFALDLGTTFRRILEQDEEAVAIFAERAGCRPRSSPSCSLGQVNASETSGCDFGRKSLSRGPYETRSFGAVHFACVSIQPISPIRCGKLHCGATGFAEVLIFATVTNPRWFPCGLARAPLNGMTLERDWQKSCQTCSRIIRLRAH